MAEDHGREAVRLRLHLFGTFRVETAGGLDLTPRSAKNRALLALLASDGFRVRTRAWLQAKLWSDRAEAQRSASLRQALSQLRRDLAGFDGAVRITRTTLALDSSVVELVLSGGDDGAAEFLEGLVVRDPEFENWLQSQRQALGRGLRRPAPDKVTRPDEAPETAADKVPAGPGFRRPGLSRPVHLVPSAERPGPEQLYEHLFCDCLERSLSEHLVAEVYRHAPLADDPRQIIVNVQAFTPGGGNMGIRLAVAEGPRRRSVWSGSRVVRMQGAPPVDHVDVLSFVHETTEAIADALALQVKTGRTEADAAVLARIAVRKIFSMTPAEVAVADRLLEQAFEMDPRAIFLAWRSQLRVIQSVERHLPEGGDAADDIVVFRNRALDLEPSNSMVLATAANASVLVAGDLETGVELARRSLDMNSANPFAWDCLSIALLMHGRPEEAHRHQLRACSLALRSPIRHFWDMGACLTSVVTGRFDLALQLARAASAMAPDFRPPLRYITALHAARGEGEQAAAAMRRLTALEPDFSLRRMVEDPTYPVAALRRSGLLSEGRLRDFL